MWIGSRLVRAQTTSFTFNAFYTQVSQHLGCLELNKRPGVCFSLVSSLGCLVGGGGRVFTSSTSDIYFGWLIYLWMYWELMFVRAKLLQRSIQIQSTATGDLPPTVNWEEPSALMWLSSQWDALSGNTSSFLQIVKLQLHLLWNYKLKKMFLKDVITDKTASAIPVQSA